MPSRTLKPAKSSISNSTKSTKSASTSRPSPSPTSSGHNSDSDSSDHHARPHSHAHGSKTSLHSAASAGSSNSGPRPALKGYPQDFIAQIPGYCSHQFDMLRSETTAKLWTCEACASTPHWFIWGCRFCEMKTCRACTYHQ